MSVTLHTTLGDISIELFCEAVPKSCEVALLLLEYLGQLKRTFLVPRTFSPCVPATTTTDVCSTEISKGLSFRRGTRQTLEREACPFGVDAMKMRLNRRFGYVELGNGSFRKTLILFSFSPAQRSRDSLYGELGAGYKWQSILSFGGT